MYWIFLTAGVAILFFLIGVVIKLFNRYAEVGGWTCMSALFICVTLALGASLINREARWEAIINDYENTVALIETYDGSNYGNESSLPEHVLYLNTKIANHKAMVKSKWSGAWYSEEIGNLTPITFKMKNTDK